MSNLHPQAASRVSSFSVNHCSASSITEFIYSYRLNIQSNFELFLVDRCLLCALMLHPIEHLPLVYLISILFFCIRKEINQLRRNSSYYNYSSYLEHNPRRLIPAFSNSTRPLSPNSIKIHPRSPLDMQSFQNDVQPQTNYKSNNR